MSGEGGCGVNVIAEDMLARLAGDRVALRVHVAIEAAGKDQERAAIRADGRRDRMVDSEIRAIGKIRIQGLQGRSFRRGRGNTHARGEGLASDGLGRLRFWLGVSCK